MMKRLALVGTAETWKDAPYGDPTWKIYSLNDAYRLGVSRADYWCDLHNPDEWLLVPEGQKVVKGWEIPPGKHYPRPAGHPTFLANLTIPAFVWQARPEWPTSRDFPFEAIEKQFGTYMASSPAWMLAQAMLPEAEGGLGYGAGDEIGIWGIHLATEKEYLEQRPNFEWLIGHAEAKGIKITIPADCPVRQHRWVYAKEKRPDFGFNAVSREVHQAAKTESALAQWLMGTRETPLEIQGLPAWVGPDPHRRLSYLRAVRAEAEGRLQAARLREQGLAV